MAGPTISGLIYKYGSSNKYADTVELKDDDLF